MTEPVKSAKKKPRIKVIPPTKIVRKLAVGNEVVGKVKRLAEFGAFLDIGVGTDALVHVSEMSQKRINKPEDIMAVGAEVRAWIKELNKEHNRISLTMIPPETRTIRDLIEGEIVKGAVTRIADFGAFVDIGVGYEAMVHVKEMAHGFVKHPKDAVQIGQEIEAQVLKVNRRRGQIDLSMKAVLPEPEPEPAPVVEEHIEEVTLEAEVEEPPLSAFEMALMEAQRGKQRNNKKRNKRQWYSDEEEGEDYVSRTLSLADSR